MKNFVHMGKSLTVTFPYAVSSGAGVKVGNIFGIAINNQSSGDDGDIDILGVYDIAKDASTFNAGDLVFWNDTAGQATSTQAGNLLIGTAELLNPDGSAPLGGATGDATVRVRLNGTAQGATTSLLAVVNLTAANILAMNGTPVSIIPAPGAGFAIVPEDFLFEMNPTSTQFASGGAVTFPYHGTSTASHAGSIPATVVNAGVGQTLTALGPAVATNGTTVPANTGIDITNATGAFTTGTGTAKVTVKYRVVAL